jgi:hypothetical protein
MQHAQVVPDILLTLHQQTAEAVQPAMGPLHHPAPRLVTRNGGLGLFLLPATADVGSNPQAATSSRPRGTS